MATTSVTRRQSPRRRRRAAIWLAVGLTIFTAGSLVAIFAVDLSDEAAERTLALVLGLASTVLGFVISLYGVFQHQDQPVVPAQAAAAPAYPPAGEALDESRSLELYLRLMSRVLDELRRDQAPVSSGVDARFVELTTAADVRLPDLKWMQRQEAQQLSQTEPEAIELDSIPTRFRRAALLGEPGSGKSTCLLELARRQLARAADNPAAQVPLPVYVSLSKWVDRHQPAADFFHRELSAKLGPGNLYSRDFANQLAGGRFLFLLDGLNELPNRQVSSGNGGHEQARQDESNLRPPAPVSAIDPRERSLRTFAQDNPLCHFVLTCRSHEYFDSPEWQVVRVQPMDSGQIEDFISTYLDPEPATRLQREIATNASLGAISANPFFLASVIAAYGPDADLTSRGLILHSLASKLLTREAARRAPESAEGEPDADVHRALSVVGAVAYRMLRRGLVGAQAPVPELSSRERAPFDVLIGTGLVVERDGEVFFRHQLVQEYLAGIALRRGVVRRRPATLLADRRWSEVVALWRDLDNRLDKRLVRCLAARNLPWRRPRSMPSVGLSLFNSVGTIAFVVAGGWALMDLVLWPAHTLSSPFGLIPLAPVIWTGILVLLRLPWSWLVPHRNVIPNTAYVLGLSDYAAALPAMIRAMGRVWHDERGRIATAVAQFEADALPHIQRGLASRRWRVRAGSVQALGALIQRAPDDEQAIETLVTAADDTDSRLTRALIGALVACPDERAQQALPAVLTRAAGTGVATSARLTPLKNLTPDERRRTWPAELVARFDELTRPANPPPVRIAILQAMGFLRLPDAEAKLTAVAADRKEEHAIRTAAVTSLGLAGTPIAAQELVDLASDAVLTHAALSALHNLTDPATIPVLVDAATTDPAFRMVVARPLARLGRGDSVPTLAEFATDPRPEVREQAAWALGLARDQAAVDVLGRLLEDEQPEVRRAALDSLLHAYPDRAVQPLLRLAGDRDYADRTAAIHALAAYNEPAVDRELKRLAGDANRRVSGLVIRLSEQIQTRRKQAAGSWWRHPIAHTSTYFARRLHLAGLRALLREEKLAGTPRGTRMTMVLGKVNRDAELATRYRVVMALYMALMTVGVILTGVFLLLLLRLILTVTGVALDYWLVSVSVLVAGALTLLPMLSRRRRYSGDPLPTPLFLVRALAVSVVVVALIGALVYTWWIWLALLLLIAFGFAFSYGRLSVRSARHAARTFGRA